MSSTPFNPMSTSIGECVPTFVTPTPITVGRPFLKVPVVLAELSAQIPMHALITFPVGQNVLEIKTIKKRTKVTQCRLIQPRVGTTSKLFLAGFVRKNIQYAANPILEPAPTPLIGTPELLSTINSLTVDVPFECVVPIPNTSFLTPPVGPMTNNVAEFDFLVSRPLGTGFPEKDTLMSTDVSQFHQQSTEFFNEQVFCELVRADITEWDEAINRVTIPGTTGVQAVEEGTFTQLSEKMILDIEFKVLQNQQVHVTSML